MAFWSSRRSIEAITAFEGGSHLMALASGVMPGRLYPVSSLPVWAQETHA